MHQMSMTGDDWMSDQDKKRQARAAAARVKAALACVKKLEAASDALSAYLSACNECGDASASRGLDDGRITLMRNINEYAGYLASVYNR